MVYVILAAGEGSRLQQEGIAVPKPLVRINGEPMIWRLMQIMAGAGAATRLRVVVNEYMTDVRQFLERQAPSLGLPVEVIVRTTPSSMHTMAVALDGLDAHDSVIATTVDTIFAAADFQRYAATFAAMGAGTVLMGVTDYIDDEKPLYVDVAPAPHLPAGVCGRITAFSDASTGTPYISGGIYGLPVGPTRLTLQHCFATGQSRMRNLQRALLDNAQVSAFAYPFSTIVDVDHAADIAVAERVARGEHLP